MFDPVPAYITFTDKTCTILFWKSYETAYKKFSVIQARQLNSATIRPSSLSSLARMSSSSSAGRDKPGWAVSRVASGYWTTHRAPTSVCLMPCTLVVVAARCLVSRSFNLLRESYRMRPSRLIGAVITYLASDLFVRRPQRRTRIRPAACPVRPTLDIKKIRRI